MSAPVQLQEIREEGSYTSVHSESDFPTHNASHDTITNSAQSPPVDVAWEPHQRRASNVSRVDIDFFDPAGVRELQRNLTHISTEGEDFDLNRKASSPGDSDITLMIGDGPLDFEKTLRDLVKKCALFHIQFHVLLTRSPQDKARLMSRRGSSGYSSKIFTSLAYELRRHISRRLGLSSTPSI
jgi:hypothetical protein